MCPYKHTCREFLDSLGLDAVYFDAQHDRCYCPTCWSRTTPTDDLQLLEKNEAHGSPYEVPKGWCGFGLNVPRRAFSKDLDVFRKWVVSFHGCPSDLIPSILMQGDLLMPGDKMMDGTTLPNRLTRGGRNRIGLYTSPSIKYAELDIYSTPVQWSGHSVRTVIQCRQKPGFDVNGETVGWKQRFGEARFSQHFTNDEIERFTRARGSIIPTRVLVGLDIRTREQEEADEAAKKEHKQQARKPMEGAKPMGGRPHPAMEKLARMPKEVDLLPKLKRDEKVRERLVHAQPGAFSPRPGAERMQKKEKAEAGANRNLELAARQEKDDISPWIRRHIYLNDATKNFINQEKLALALRGGRKVGAAAKRMRQGEEDSSVDPGALPLAAAQRKFSYGFLGTCALVVYLIGAIGILLILAARAAGGGGEAALALMPAFVAVAALLLFRCFALFFFLDEDGDDIADWAQQNL